MINRLTNRQPFRVAVLWTVSFLPAMWWFSSAPLSSAQSWKSGQSTFDGQAYDNSDSAAISELSLTMPSAVESAAHSSPTFSDTYQPQFEVSSSIPISAQSIPSNLEAAPYTVPVDPSLYTQPMVQGVQNSVTDSSNAIANAIAKAGFDQTLDYTGSSIESIPSIDTSPADSIELSQYRQAINNNIKTGIIGSPPLSGQTSSWYSDTWRWMTQGWTNHIELGIDGSQGNSETFAFQTGAEVRRKTDAYTLSFDVDYRSVTSRDVTTEDNGRFNIDFDRLIAGTPWALFTKFGLEWDEFKAFDLRLNINGGLGYHWIRNDRTTFITRFGAGASREIGAPDDSWVPEAVFGFEGEHQVNKYNKVRAKVDYFPDWTDFDNYRLVSDFSWEILIGGSDNLSLKLGLNDRYDSTPQGGAEANDFFYSLLLLVKL